MSTDPPSTPGPRTVEWVPPVPRETAYDRGPIGPGGEGPRLPTADELFRARYEAALAEIGETPQDTTTTEETS